MAWSKLVFVFLVFACSNEVFAILCGKAECWNDTHFQIPNFPAAIPCDELTPICNDECKEGEELCVDGDTLCAYTCSTDLKTVDYDGMTLTCPQNTICNEDKKPPCHFCVCNNSESYECVNGKVQVYGLLLDCPTGSVCNEKKEFPCSFCVQSGNTTEPTESPTTASPTTKPSVATTTVATTEGTTTPATTTTASTIPDCNNPSGSFAPCRHGPKGIYFRCVKIADNYYKPIAQSCTSLKNDVICRRYNLC